MFAVFVAAIYGTIAFLGIVFCIMYILYHICSWIHNVIGRPSEGDYALGFALLLFFFAIISGMYAIGTEIIHSLNH